MCDDMQFFFFLNYPDVGKAGLGQQLFQFFGSVHRHSLYPLRPRLSEFGVARFQTDEKAAPFPDHAEDFGQRLADGRPEIDGLEGRNGIEGPVPLRQAADIALLYETSAVQFSRIVPAGEGDALLR